MADVSRRGFISGMGAACAATGAAAPKVAKVPKGVPNVSFGVLSDVHLERRGDEDTLLKALAYFRDNGADGVMIAGDIANTGRIEQMERAADCFWRTFPDGKAPDGRHVEQLWVYGNHEFHNWGWFKGKDEAFLKANSLRYGNNRAEVWERIFHEPYKPIWAKTVKGYTFIGAHWGNEKDLPKRQAVLLRAASASRKHRTGPLGVGQRRGLGHACSREVPERRGVLRPLALLHHRRALHLAGEVHVGRHGFAPVHLLAVLARQRRGP